MPSQAPMRDSSVGSSLTNCGSWSGLPSHVYSAQFLSESSVSPVPGRDQVLVLRVLGDVADRAPAQVEQDRRAELGVDGCSTSACRCS